MEKLDRFMTRVPGRLEQAFIPTIEDSRHFCLCFSDFVYQVVPRPSDARSMTQVELVFLIEKGM
jgi:hypothetical protein